jgi:hypothetical protein
MSTYSSNLKIELIATGDQSGVWGTTTNSNFSNVFEQSIVGRVTVSFSNADVTLTATNTVASQDYRNVYLNCTGTNAASRNLIVPTLNKNYIVENNTTGGFSIVVKTSAGTGITIPNGSKCAVYVDGTNVVQNDNYFPAAVFASITDSGLTSGRVTFASTSGLLADSANLTWDGSFLTAASIKDTALTSGRVTYAGASGLLSDSASLTFDGTSLTTPRLVLGGTTLPSAGTATLFSRTSDNNTYLQTGSGNNVLFLDGSQNTLVSFSPTALNFNISNTAKLTLNSTTLYTASGVNVGIGTSSPAGRLDVQDTTGIIRLASSTGTNGVYLYTTNTGGDFYIGRDNSTGTTFSSGSAYSSILYSAGAYPMVFFTNATKQMTLDTSGNLGLGVTPSAWRSTDRAFEIGSVGKSLMAPASGNSIYLATNWYISTAPANVYAANGLATRYAQSDGVHTWWNAPNNTSGAGAALTFTQAMTLNDSGNLSLSITPSSWGSTYKAFQAGGYAAYVGDGNNGYAEILNNAYASNNNIFNYYDTNSAGRYSIQLGVHKWFSTGSGSANAQITWTQAMTLTSAGNLGIGETSPSDMLDVKGNARVGQGQISSDATVGILGIYGGLAGGTTNAQLKFFGKSVSNTGNTYEIGRISGGSFSPGGSYSLDGGLQFSTASNNGANVLTLAERMRIDSAGNVSIGGFAPNAQDAGYRFINFSNVTGAFVGGSSYAVQLGANVYINTSSVSVFGGGSFKASKYTQFDGGHFWYRSTATPVAGNDVVWSQPMTLDNAGNLLVGTTSSIGNGGVLQAKGPGAVFYAETNSSSGSQNVIDIANVSNTAYKPMRFWVNGYPTTEVGSITCTTSVTSYNVTSDYRLKENIAPMTGALAKVAQLNPVTYRWKTDGSDGQGFIAHELQAVVPDCVTGEKDAVDEDGKPQYQAMDTSHLVATLVSAIQEQQALIESLTTRLTALENK